jgi:hypothetical protein
MISTNNNNNIVRLLQTNTNAGGKAEGNAPNSPNSKAAGKASLQWAKQNQPKTEASAKQAGIFQTQSAERNQSNATFLSAFQQKQLTNIEAIQASGSNSFASASTGESPVLSQRPMGELGGRGPDIVDQEGKGTRISFDGSSSLPAFDLKTAQATFSNGALDFTNGLKDSSIETKAAVDNATDLGVNTGDALQTAGGLFEESGSDLLTGAGMIITGLSTSGFFGLGLPLVLAGGAQVFSGGNKMMNGQQKSETADNTANQSYDTAMSAFNKLNDTDGKINTFKGFQDTINNSVFPTLWKAQGQNDTLVSLASQIDPSIQAPATLANPADPAGASNGMAPTTPATTAPPFASSSWAIPATNALGSTATTALGVSPAGVNTTQATPQAVGLNAEETAFMTAFARNSDIVNTANGELQSVVSSEAPTGFNTAGLASQTVTDASQSQGLQELYARLQAKEEEAQAQKGGQANVPQLGQNAQNALAPQEPLVNPADPNAVAQAPQAKGDWSAPATPETAPAKPPLSIPNLAQAPTAPSLALV